MDPLTAAAISATLVPLVTGAAGEAGKAAWASLVSYARNRFGGEPAVLDAAEVLQRRPEDFDAAQRLAEQLTAGASRHPDVEAWLRAWHAGAQALVSNVTTNTVSGTVHGTVVQGNTFGSVTISAPPQHG